MPGAFGGAHGVALDDHFGDVGGGGVCQGLDGGQDLCGDLGQQTRVPGLLSQGPEQLFRLVCDPAVFGALLAQDPAQAVVPDLTVQAGKALDAHLCRFVDVLEQFNVVHVWITSPLVCPAFPGKAVDLPGEIRYNSSV